MRRFIAIAGTWAQRDPWAPPDPWRDWWHPYSHWSAHMRLLDWQHAYPDPYVWSTDLDGTWLQRLVQRRRWGDWVAAAYALCYYAGHRPSVAIERVAGRASAEVERHVSAIRPRAHRPDDQIVLVAHSHGGQVALLATGVLGLPVAGLVTVCTPVRRDVLDVAGNGVPRPWLHLHSDQADRWQWLGEWGDGAVGIVRRMPPPAINVPAAVGLGHSGLLTTAAGMRVWPSVVRAFEAEASS